MTVTPDVLGNRVEGRTYQLDVLPDGKGGVRWDLFDYRRNERGQLGWRQVATATSETPADGGWRGTALWWLRSLGHDVETMDAILILPDGVERIGR